MKSETQNLAQRGLYLLLALGFTMQMSACSSASVSELAATEVPYNGNIRLSLAHPHDPSKDDYDLLFASAPQTVELGICIVQDATPCVKGGANYFALDLIYSTTTKTFFRTKEASSPTADDGNSALLATGLILEAVAYDQTGNIFDKRQIEFTRTSPAPAPSTAPAAGTATTAATVAAPSPTPDPGLGGFFNGAPPTTTNTNTNTNTGTSNTGSGNGNQGGGYDQGDYGQNGSGQTGAGTAGADVQQVVNQFCGTCHPQYAADPSSLLSTNALALVQSGQMPQPPVSMDPNAQQLLLQYLSGQL